MKKTLALISFLSLCSPALSLPAPGAGIPALFIRAPTGQEQINVYGVGPQIQTIYLTQARDSSGHELIQQAATEVITVQNGVSILAFYGPTPGTGTITLPSAPVDGQRLRVFTTAGFTSITFVPNVGQALQTDITQILSIAAEGFTEFLFNLSDSTWYRIL